jgi:cytidine deaminase
MIEKSFEALSPEEQELLLAAEKAMENGYEPYSRFLVGAALRTEGGKIYCGADVENACYGLGTCAERSAFSVANAAGDRSFTAIATIGRGETFDNLDPVTPCGACRQWINEFAQLVGHDILVFCSNTKKDRVLVTSIHELLPKAFGPADVMVDLAKYRR